MATPSNVSDLKRQREIFDLNTMDEVLLIKKGTFAQVESLEEAKMRVGGDTEKFLSIINEGLKAEAGRAMVNDPAVPWLVEDEEGNTTPFDGKPADKKIVGGLILNLAKSVFGYAKGLAPAEKKAAKESAMEMIKTNEVMKAGLIKNAAAQSAASGSSEE
jgi:hypothetical protein